MVVRLPEEAMKLGQTLTDFVRRQSHGVPCEEKATQPHSRNESRACADTGALPSISIGRVPSNAHGHMGAQWFVEGRKSPSGTHTPARLRSYAGVATWALSAGCGRWELRPGGARCALTRTVSIYASNRASQSLGVFSDARAGPLG
jgi:hypothetical protein